MELAVFALIVLVSGLVIGMLARLAVPGPDPMPLWQTILLGIAGSFVGGVVGAFFLGDAAVAWSFPLALGGATLLLILYRRLIQGRPIVGPGANRPPGA